MSNTGAVGGVCQSPSIPFLVLKFLRLLIKKATGRCAFHLE